MVFSPPSAGLGRLFDACSLSGLALSQGQARASFASFLFRCYYTVFTRDIDDHREVLSQYRICKASIELNYAVVVCVRAFSCIF